MNRFFGAIFWVLWHTNTLHAQAWKLSKDKDGIRVYTAVVDSSCFKAVKAQCEADASLSQVVAAFLDLKGHDDWAYCTKGTTLLKKISESEAIYYAVVDAPWPLSDRDAVLHFFITQDPATHIVSIKVISTPNFIPQKDGYVRVPASTSLWTITPIGKKKTRIDYTVRVNPGGSVPSWVINMFCTKGPYESFQKLERKLPVYQNAHFNFIVD